MTTKYSKQLSKEERKEAYASYIAFNKNKKISFENFCKAVVVLNHYRWKALVSMITIRKIFK